MTEKSVTLKDMFNRYSFEVSLDASKHSIRTAVESYFKVSVEDVRTMIVRGKFRRIGRYSGQRSNWKKAVVTLAAGQKLDIFEVQ